MLPGDSTILASPDRDHLTCGVASIGIDATDGVSSSSRGGGRMDTPSKPDRATELHAQLTRGLADLVTGEDWRRALEVASRFHDYSFGNCTGDQDARARARSRAHALRRCGEHPGRASDPPRGRGRVRRPHRVPGMGARHRGLGERSEDRDPVLTLANVATE